MTEYSLSLAGIGDAIPALSIDIPDPHGGRVRMARHPDAYSPVLFHAQTSGTHMETGAVTVGGATYSFEDVMVSGYQLAGDVEDVELSYSKIAIDATTPDGGDASHHHADYNVATQESSESSWAQALENEGIE